MKRNEQGIAHLDDISFVMIDGNNVPNDMAFSIKAGGINNTETSRLSQRRGSNSMAPGIPLPAVLKANHEVLMLVASGQT